MAMHLALPDLFHDPPSSILNPQYHQPLYSTMTVILIGATGTLGSAIRDAIAGDHEVISVSRSSGDLQADLSDPDSLRALYDDAPPFDAVICAAGNAAFNPLEDLSDDDFALSVNSKLMGQVNLVRYGLPHVRRDGNPSFTLVSGVLSQNPIPGSAAISMVNAGVEGFVRAAALEAGDVRVNVVSPPWISETLEAMGQDPSNGVPAATAADAFVDSLEGEMSGEVIEAG
jgi:NAD(P)-dependent dehydrogenase (short-subunit alcohol dehydrogenase family)